MMMKFLFIIEDIHPNILEHIHLLMIHSKELTNINNIQNFKIEDKKAS